MSVAVDSLVQEALSLPADKRVALACRLLVSVEPGAEAAWEAEIASRIARFDAGQTRAIPAAEVFDAFGRMAPGD